MKELPMISTSGARWYGDVRGHLAEEHGVESDPGMNILLAMDHGKAHIYGTFADGKEPHRHLPQVADVEAVVWAVRLQPSGALNTSGDEPAAHKLAQEMCECDGVTAAEVVSLSSDQTGWQLRSRYEPGWRAKYELEKNPRTGGHHTG